jgi:hypothetical protein
MCISRPLACAIFSVVVGVRSAALAWDAHGHKMITRVALQGLDETVPSWVKDADSVVMTTEGCSTPDRWRSIATPQLKHDNEPDHYFDIEDLEPLGLTMDSLPTLRYEFVKAVTLARSKPGFPGMPVDPMKDPVRVQEYPGFLPYATVETWARLVSAFRTVRTLEQLSPTANADKIEAARWTARYHIGILSHWVGDAAQPLHTTRHHHGWVGDNPNNYSTDRNIHRYIDGDVLVLHAITDADLTARFDPSRAFTPENVWASSLAHIQRSFDQMVPLYEMHKTGTLQQAPGKAFITERLADGSSQLAACIEAAWLAAAPTPKDLKDFTKYDTPPAQPATDPARTATPAASPTEK